MAARQRPRYRLWLEFSADDLQLLSEAIRTELETGCKTGQHDRRVHLYRLLRVIGRARISLLGPEG